MRQTRQPPSFPWFLAAALAIAGAAALPLLGGDGLLNTRGGGDSPFLLQRSHQLFTALLDGHFPVRWMPDANYGYGYPFFNFYAPLAFYVSSLFRLIGVDIVRSIQLSQLIAFLLAAGGMFALMWRWSRDHWVSLLASAAYTLAPFHLVNVYVRGDSIAEFWAMAFYPLVILATEAIVAPESKRPLPLRLLAFGSAYAGLILSHNISAMIFSPFVALTVAARLFLPIRPALKPASLLRTGRIIGYMALAVVLGLALSAWFWLPAIGERHLTRVDDVTIGYFNYNYNDGYHFRTLDLAQTSFIYDPDVGGGRAFRMGLFQALVFVAGLLSFAHGRVRRQIGGSVGSAIVGGCLLATFMMTPYALFLWDNLPLLPFTQFPWRFLSIQAFWGGALGGGILWLLPERSRWRSIVGLAIITILLITSLGGLRPNYLPLTDAEITAADLAQYEWFTGNIGTTISAEYLPAGVHPRPVTGQWLQSGQRWSVTFLEGTGAAVPLETKTGAHTWQLTINDESATIVIPILYWDGWEAYLNGQPIPIQAAPSSGLIQLTIPAGAHTLDLRLERTETRLWAERLSLVAAVLLGLVWLWYRPWRDGHVWTGTRLWPWFIPVALVAWWAYWPATTAVGIETWDFGQMAYLHRQPSIRYGHGATLVDVEMPSTAMAGETISITLTWVDAPPGDIRDVTVTLTHPGTNFYNFVTPLAQEVGPLIDERPVTYELQIPVSAPSGLTIPQVTLSDRNRPRGAWDLKRGALYFAPIRVMTPPLEADRVAQLDARPLAVTQRRPDVIDIELAWTTATPLAENLMVSARLTDAFGREIFESQFDIQPQYGQQPTSLWAPGRWTNDRFSLRLPEQLPPDAPYFLLVKLYEADSGRVRLTRKLGQLVPQADRLLFEPVQPQFALPADLIPVDVSLERAGTQIALRGYQLEEQEAQLVVTLFWEALTTVPTDLTHFVHLIDPQTGLPAAQHDGMPQHNTYPTTQWTVGEIISDVAVLPLGDVPAGEFTLTAGLYEVTADGYPRWSVMQDGDSAPNDSANLRRIYMPGN